MLSTGSSPVDSTMELNKCICVKQYNNIFKKGRIYDCIVFDGRYSVVRDDHNAGASISFHRNDFVTMFMYVSDYRNNKID